MGSSVRKDIKSNFHAYSWLFYGNLMITTAMKWITLFHDPHCNVMIYGSFMIHTVM